MDRGATMMDRGATMMDRGATRAGARSALRTGSSARQVCGRGVLAESSALPQLDDYLCILADLPLRLERVVPLALLPLHLPLLGGEGVVGQVVIAARVKVDGPRHDQRHPHHVLPLAPLRDDATKRSSALSLLAKSALNSTRLVALASAETFSELAVRHLESAVSVLARHLVLVVEGDPVPGAALHLHLLRPVHLHRLQPLHRQLHLLRLHLLLHFHFLRLLIAHLEALFKA